MRGLATACDLLTCLCVLRTGILDLAFEVSPITSYGEAIASPCASQSLTLLLSLRCFVASVKFAGPSVSGANAVVSAASAASRSHRHSPRSSIFAQLPSTAIHYINRKQ